MDIDSIVKLAEKFDEEAIIKDVKPEDLDFLDEHQKAYIKAMGKAFENPMNPPDFIGSEKTWKRAKKAIKKRWGKYSEPYAVLMHVYQNMGGKIKKHKKK